MTTLTLGQCGIKPRLSMLIINDAPVCDIPISGITFERVVVTPGVDPNVRFTSGERRIRSSAPPTRRLNLAISLASGEWVVPIIGDVEPSADCLLQLEHQIVSNRDVCVLILRGEDDDVLFAIRRRAFAYGALDENLGDARVALFDWVQRIFPSHKYRTIGCEGVRHFQIGGLRGLTIPNADKDGASTLSKLEPSKRTSAPITENYDPKNYWTQGTAEYVKWEVFQPDEPEIEEMLRLTRPNRVLELGCGAGRNIRYFSGCEQYVGIDIASNLLHRASDRVEANTLGLVRGDVVRLPFASKMFDLIFSTSTVQHVVPERIDDCIADMLRVSARYICLIEFVDELPEYPGWFGNIHMFKHDYASLMRGRARLLRRGATGLQIQPAVKEYFLFEKI